MMIYLQARCASIYRHWQQRKIALLLPVSEASKQASNKRKPTDCTRDGKQLGTKQSGYRRLGSCRGISLLRSGDESLETPHGRSWCCGCVEARGGDVDAVCSYMDGGFWLGSWS